MGNFLVVVSSGEPSTSAEPLFRAGLESARGLLRVAPSATLENGGTRAAVFPRLNGSHSAIVTDPTTATWLFTIGTWFHPDGYAAGSESRLLERYLRVGAEKLGSELQGFFVIVIGDARTSEVVVVTDIVGSCHCFLRKIDGLTALSGSSLLLASLAPFDLDEIGCQEFLRAGIIYEDRTCYKQVRKLGPASVLRLGSGTAKPASKYWTIGEITPESVRGDAAPAALWKSLTTAAATVGRAFPKPVCDLTGGYDSRAMVAAFWAAGVPVNTVVSGPEDSPDVLISRQLAEIAHIPHQRNPSFEHVTFAQVADALPFTDGEYDLVEYARILAIHRSLMSRFELSVNGSFGEVARGYWWELLFPRAGAREKLDAKKVGGLRFGATTDEPRLFPSETRLDLASHFASIIERANAGLSGAPNTLQMDNVYLTMRMQRWQGRVASSTNRIWPCISPFMFRPVLETMLATEARLRRRGLVIRQMLAEFRPAWATVPLEHGYPAMPARPGNLPRFLPVLGHYGAKVWSKALRAVGAKRGPTAPRSAAPPLRYQLWQADEVRAILDPRTARLGGFLDASALAEFLRQSQNENFEFDAEWNRLLSMEYALRLLDKETTVGSPSRENVHVRIRKS